jgi:hypothetical protein
MSDGTIYVCGLNGYFQFGFNDNNDRRTLTKINSLPTTNGIKPILMNCSYYNTIVLMSNGTIYVAGSNSYGQLGIDSITTARTFREMTPAKDNDGNPITAKPTTISISRSHTIVLMSDNTLYGCGLNEFGELGDDTTTNRSTLIPITVPDGKIATSISCGGYHTTVLMSDGSVYGCGSNGSGQLGIGNTTNSSTLTQMKGENGVGFITNIVSLADGTIVLTPQPIPPPPCFKEGSLILTIDGYVPVQNLRKGDLVKTLNHDYVPIDMIGKKDIFHSASQERIKDQLYKCSQSEYPEIFEDLVITGCHSILIDDFTSEEQREKTIEVNGDAYVTDDKYRLPACVDMRTSVYETPGTYTIYHFALENDDYYMNYGIFANGLLVETTSKRYLKELSNMMLIE